MAKFLVLSAYGDSLALAHTLQHEKHDVKCWIQDPERKHRFDGILTKVVNYEDALEDDRIILCGMTGIGADDQHRPETESDWKSYTNIAHELREKGLSEAAIAGAQLQLQESELETARAVWTKKFGVMPANASAKARQMRFLQGRGFSLDIIRRLLRDIE